MTTTGKSTKKNSQTPVRKAKPTKKQIIEVIEKTKSKAEAYIHDPEKAKGLLDDAVNKTKNFKSNRGALGEIWSYLTALFRLLKAYIQKDYREIPWGSMVLVIIGIIYFVSPADLIPDILPGGYIDDAAVIAFVVSQIRVDLDNFMAWEVSHADNEGVI